MSMGSCCWCHPLFTKLWDRLKQRQKACSRVGKLNVLAVLSVCVCECLCWGWERAVPVDTCDVRRAGSLTGAVTGTAGGSLSINPPSCQSNPLTAATRAPVIYTSVSSLSEFGSEKDETTRMENDAS